MSTPSSSPSSASAVHPVSPHYAGRLGALGAGAALVVLVASVGACSVGATPSPSAALTIGDPWVRMPGGMDQPTAAYLTISNPGGAADALLSAASPGAASVELHETAMASDGMVGMHPVSRVDVPAGGTVALAPGGYHLMISGLKTELRPGDRLELDLVFDRAGTVVVQAEVRQG
jgi:periplasmic copper chaperone A